MGSEANSKVERVSKNLWSLTLLAILQPMPTSLRDRALVLSMIINLETRFDLKDQDQTLQGQVAATGIYVKEDDSVGTIQEIYLVV